MSIRIIAVGKKHESWVSEGIERYQKRLKRPFDVEWLIIPHSQLSGTAALKDESQRLISHLSSEYVVLLDERGKIISSPELSNQLCSHLDTSHQITIIIGGAYGVDETITHRANFVWSLSHLVFPHQLVRLMLIEQLYRAQEIAGNKPYHHE